MFEWAKFVVSLHDKVMQAESCGRTCGSGCTVDQRTVSMGACLRQFSDTREMNAETFRSHA
jgi:hypothetical protein